MSMNKMIPIIFLLLSMSAYADPPTPEQWAPVPALTDEFNGESLDSTKWHDRNPGWQGRQPGFFSPQNVSVKDGMLQLTAKAENLPNLPDGYHTFTTAAVKSKTLIKYGYLEIRCKPMNSRASSAFWLYHNTPEIWTEIDVFEICGLDPNHERKYHTNAHVFHSPTYKGTPDEHLSDAAVWEAPYRLADEFHIYALEWNEKELIWYVDGKVIRTKKNEYWHQPLHVNFDSETMPKWFGLPLKENLPSTFCIDYIRTWEKVEK
jgi:beta-glucanase (GH16 family)